jgi:RNA polymerase sigma-70 factor (ECF subfamily)
MNPPHAAAAVMPRLLLVAFAQGLDALFSVDQVDEAGREAGAHQPDAEDISAVCDGDEDRFAAIVTRYQAAVAAMMWRFTRDPWVLDELVQNTFVEAYTSLRSFDRSRPFLPWLRKIAVRVGYRHWKCSSKPYCEVSLDAVGDIPDERPEPTQPAASEILHALLAQLPPRDRLVITLLNVEGCSIAEAAQLTGWSRVMVKVQAHRARSKLRKIVRKRHGNEVVP